MTVKPLSYQTIVRTNYKTGIEEQTLGHASILLVALRHIVHASCLQRNIADDELLSGIYLRFPLLLRYCKCATKGKLQYHYQRQAINGARGGLVSPCDVIRICDLLLVVLHG